MQSVNRLETNGREAAPPESIVIGSELAQDILDFLVRQPYGAVYQLVGRLMVAGAQASQSTPDPESEEAKP